MTAATLLFWPCILIGNFIHPAVLVSCDSCASCTAWRSLMSQPRRRISGNSNTRKLEKRIKHGAKRHCQCSLQPYTNWWQITGGYTLGALANTRSGTLWSMDDAGKGKRRREEDRKKKLNSELNWTERTNERNADQENNYCFLVCNTTVIVTKNGITAMATAAPRNSLLHNFVLAFACVLNANDNDIASERESHDDEQKKRV